MLFSLSPYTETLKKEEEGLYISDCCFEKVLYSAPAPSLSMFCLSLHAILCQCVVLVSLLSTLQLWRKKRRRAGMKAF